MLRRDTDAVVVVARGDIEVGCWPLAGCGRPDLAVVDELVRMALAARRVGYSIRLREACPELLDLLRLVGLVELLTGVAGVGPGALGVEAGGEAEGGEQVGVEEVVVPDDPVA